MNLITILYCNYILTLLLISVSCLVRIFILINIYVLSSFFTGLGENFYVVSHSIYILPIQLNFKNGDFQLLYVSILFFSSFPPLPLFSSFLPRLLPLLLIIILIHIPSSFFYVSLLSIFFSSTFLSPLSLPHFSSSTYFSFFFSGLPLPSSSQPLLSSSAELCDQCLKRLHI